MKYTRISDPEVEKRLADAMTGIAADIQRIPVESQPLAVYLGGGYGRGEGGVAVKDDGTHSPYNDLDFFVFGKDAAHCKRAGEALHPLEEKWSKILDVEVEFATGKPVSKLTAFHRTLMFQELYYGHQMIFGETDVLDSSLALEPSQIPPVEALRLFLNRGAGLLFAAQRIFAEGGMDEEQRDFSVRNLHKAALGCGDALLIVSGQYKWKCQERLEQLKAMDLPEKELLVPAYEAALEFKARPAQDPVTDLAERWITMRKLWQSCLVFTAKGQGKSAETVQELQRQLSTKRFEARCTPLRNALRWILRTKQIFPLKDLCLLPLIRTLLELCDLLFENPVANNYSSRLTFFQGENAEKFVRHWRLFN